MKREIGITMAFAVSMLLLSACGKQQPKPAEEEMQVPVESQTEADKTAESQGKTDEGLKLQKSTGKTKKNKDNDQKGEVAGDKKNDETKPVTLLGVETGLGYDYYWNEEYEYVGASLQYPFMNLSEEDRAEYPELEKSITELMKERKESGKELYAEAVQLSKEYAEEESEYQIEYEVSETATVRRADTRIFSILLDGYYYQGGAHGVPYSMGMTFDTVTGERLKLKDVVTEVEKLPDLVKEQLEIFWGMDIFYEDLDLNEFFEENEESIQWILDYHGITFYFNPYEIAPYVAGIQSATVSFADHPEIFKEEYLEVPECYGVEFVTEKEFYYDTDGNGTLDSILVGGLQGEYGNYETVSVLLNGVWYEEDVLCYQIAPVLIHMGDAKNYLYMGQQYSDGYWVYSIFDISGGTIEKIEDVYSGMHNIINPEEEYYAFQVLTDPQHFLMDTYTYMLGTAYGYNTYHVGENGLPEKEHDWYTIDNHMEYTMLKDLSVSIVDEEGNKTGTTELKSGEKVIYYRTDGENWADLMLKDGSIVRVNPVNEDGIWEIDGTDIEEIFDGIIFAG